MSKNNKVAKTNMYRIVYTMRKNLPKTLDLLIFSHNLQKISKFLPPQRHKTQQSY